MKALRVVLFVLVLIVSFVIVTPSALAGDVNLEFGWDQDAVTVSDPGFNGWRLYMSETSGTYTDPPIATVNYGSQTPPYTTTEVIVSPDEEKHTYYFVLTAFKTATDGERESDYSNEVSQVIDFKSPGIPFSLTITVTPTP